MGDENLEQKITEEKTDSKKSGDLTEEIRSGNIDKIAKKEKRIRDLETENAEKEKKLQEKDGIIATLEKTLTNFLNPKEKSEFDKWYDGDKMD